MREILNSKKLVVYVASLVLPMLGIVPLGIRHFGINKWCILGCLCAAIMAIIIMASTIDSGKRKWAVSATILITVIMAVFVLLARWVPIPPWQFFVCYYVVDILAITVSIAINIISDYYPNKNSSNRNQRGIV